MNNTHFKMLVLLVTYVLLSLFLGAVLALSNIASFGSGFVLSIVAMVLVHHWLKRIQQG
jgi:hypothetical protein